MDIFSQKGKLPKCFRLGITMIRWANCGTDKCDRDAASYVHQEYRVIHRFVDQGGNSIG